MATEKDFQEIVEEIKNAQRGQPIGPYCVTGETFAGPVDLLQELMYESGKTLEYIGIPSMSDATFKVTG